MSETKRPRLAIISSWNDSCGNASYTFVLKKEFEKHYDVEVLGLDLFLLRQTGSRFRKQARRHIDAMAAKLAQFDYVNIQFEAGLYGATVREIERNVRVLMNAAPNLVLTMHRIDLETNSLVKDLVLSFVAMSLGPLRRRRSLGDYAWLYKRMVLQARALSARKNVWVKVHTKRERRVVQEFFDMPNVVDSPLCFLDRDERARILGDFRPNDMRARYNLPPNAKTIGAFGYIANYKGFEELIRTIRILPPEWYLMVVGSQHPQSVRAWQPIDGYLGNLLRGIKGAPSLATGPSNASVTNKLDTDVGMNLTDDTAGLIDRVHFIGNVGDDEFTFLLRNVDATVLPYLEVGQSMSGVVALAVESGARLFCSNNLSFGEVRRYYGDVFGRFDMGNYIEIAQKVQYDHSDYADARDALYEKYNIAKLVELHRRMFEGRMADEKAA